MYYLQEAPLSLYPEIVLSEAMVQAKNNIGWAKRLARIAIDRTAHNISENQNKQNFVESGIQEGYEIEFEELVVPAFNKRMEKVKSQYPDLYAISHKEAKALYSTARKSLDAINNNDAGYIVETGVNKGISSFILLNAIKHSRKNVRLLSYDLPYLGQDIKDIGVFVDEELEQNWDLVVCPTQDLLPDILANLSEKFNLVGFMHDSKHTFGHMYFEMMHAFKNSAGFIACHDAAYPNPMRSPFKVFCEENGLNYTFTESLGITTIQ